ncbi:MAG: endonuclease III [Dehalococcoidia bacterium]|nr:endonuclease III [Dehalococcoidia bacterium]
MSDSLRSSIHDGADAGTDVAARLPDVLCALDAEYGPRVWESRGRAVDVLIETVLSQNTADVNSHRAFESLVDQFGSMEGVARAGVQDIESAISASGLSKIKSVRIKSMLESLERENGSLDLSFLSSMELKAALDYLTAFKGVGLKTASCVLLFALGLPALPVDTHVHRVARRLGLIDSRVAAEAAHAALEAIVAPDDRYRFHLHLIEHGRLICHARRPKCGDCVLNSLCPGAFSV